LNKVYPSSGSQTSKLMLVHGDDLMNLIVGSYLVSHLLRCYNVVAMTQKYSENIQHWRTNSSHTWSWCTRPSQF
jgi:hypothetical protein